MEKIKEINTDYLIVGSGIAGLFTALNLSRLGKVIVITKKDLSESNTSLAQGGIAAVSAEGDSWESHFEDTIRAGAGLCNKKAVEIMVREGPGRINELMKMGVSFDYKGDQLDLTREGGHSRKRILHARGDRIGVEIIEVLSEKIAVSGNIEVHENTFLLELLKSNYKDEDRVCGVLARTGNLFRAYIARAVILASGGCSMIYSNTTNSRAITGDGIAAAYRAGADIMDMEFEQFHPTALYNPPEPFFLISESVRGEGGILLNKKGKRFMPDYHPMAELAPRDIVARAIYNEARKDSRPYVWLDVRKHEVSFLKKRFPLIYSTLKEKGIDMAKDLIPVAPAAHYLMGGIRTDLYGRSSVKGLYACGEAACTGVHGANRLASNSLLEGLVFSGRIPLRILAEEKDVRFPMDRLDIELPEFVTAFQAYNTLSFDEDRQEFREKMTERAGIEREAGGLISVLDWLEKNRGICGKREKLSDEGYELMNMMTVGELTVRASLLREESRGCHYRKDFSESSADWENKHIVLNKNSGSEVIVL
ncbi:MAG: L-aspartate oxidase [Halanaerobiaceae bacterium]|nr:L-aspartate oxidase [Halanaerobiaceae bacterium]